MADNEEMEQRRSLLNSALDQLNPRERHIVAERHLKDSPTTLADLSRHYGVTSERIRQIELRAMTKLQRSVRAALV